MKRFLVLSIIFSTILLSLSVTNIVNAYQVDYFLSNTTANSRNILPSFFSNLNCRVEMTPYVSFNSTSFPYTATVDYFSPQGSQIAISPQTFSTNRTFFNFGLANTTNKTVNNVYENRFDLIDTATTRIIFPNVKYVCSGNNLLNYQFRNDTAGFETNIYYSDCRGNGVPSDSTCFNNGQPRNIILNSTNFGFNKETYKGSGNYIPTDLRLFTNTSDTVGGSIDVRRQDIFYIVFNSSNGQISYTVDFNVIGGSGQGQQINLYPLDNPAGFTILCSTSTCSGTQTLDKNKIYVFEAHKNTLIFQNTMQIRNPIQNFSVDVYEPNYVCGEFTACVNGTRQRTCVDSGGVEPDLIEPSACFSGENVFSQLILGFEDVNATTQNILECKKDPNTCTATPQSITINLPVNWTVIFPLVNHSSSLTPHELLAFMTTEQAYSGFRSLEINYYPPQLDTVTTAGNPANPSICSNSTSGFFPQVFTTNLSNVIISNSFQFPTQFSALTWAVKKAQTPHTKLDIRGSFCDFIGDPNVYQCYSGYGQSCNISETGNQITGKYQILLSEVNETTGDIIQNVFRFFGTGLDNWSVVTADLLNAGIQPNTPYRIIIATEQPDVFDPKPNRLFFDDFRIQNLFVPLVSNCTSTCVGYDFLRATESNGTCFTVLETNDSTCTAQTVALIQQQQQQDTFGGLFNLINQTELDRQGLGFVGFFISPFFLFLLGIVVFGAGTEIWIGKNTKVGTGGMAFAFIFLIGLIGMAIVFPALAWISVVLIIIAGLIITERVRGIFTGKGG